MSSFEKYTPSVVAISTPFQAICAIAAIRQLEIDDYLFLAYFPDNNERNVQLKELLNNFGIKYKPIRINRLTYQYYKFCSRRRKTNRFKRLFVGDNRSYANLLIGCCFVSYRADVVYLDDGNNTIALLNGIKLPGSGNNDSKEIQKLSEIHRLKVDHNFLTIYKGISNFNYNLSYLELFHLFDKVSMLRKTSGVFIVGTVLEECCITDEEKKLFVTKLGKLMMRLKKEYPGEDIIYIPHGRDASEYAYNLCNTLSCKFLRPRMMVEMEMICSNLYPKAVYGFSSSALYNLKQMYPKTRVVNVLFLYEDEKRNQPYIIISDYYLQNNIELIKEKMY